MKTSNWNHLAPNPKSGYRQLFVKGTRIRARVLYGLYLSDEEPMTPEEIAADYGLPLDAVLEAIAYCETNPLEVAEDFQREERIIQATGMNDPDAKYGGKYRILSPLDRAKVDL